jgi:pseudaminic acid synthase
MKIGKFDLKTKTFIIAELSANHDHNYDIAKETVKAAKDAGADAIKLQTYTPDTITMDVDNEYFRVKQGTIWDGKKFYDLYKEAYTPWEWQPKLKKYAEELGLICFSSPFDKTSVDFLEKIDVPAYKIASFEITDIPLISYVAAKGKPMIISTGIASLNDIELAVETCRKQRNDQIALLKCTSSYPADPKDAHLRTIPNLTETFNVISGLSDHTMGSAVAVAGVALGAKIIEKHFIIDRTIGGPDASFSMEPREFKSMVKDIRTAENSLGRIDYKMNEKKIKNRELSKSIFFSKDLKKGEKIDERNIRVVRPNFGLHPKYLYEILNENYVASIDVKRGMPVQWNSIRKQI